MQVLVGFDRGSVITVFPKRAMSLLAVIVFLRRPAGDQLHALGYDIPACVFNQKMDVVWMSPYSSAPIDRTASLFRKPNANTGDDRAETLVEIAVGDSGE